MSKKSSSKRKETIFKQVSNKLDIPLPAVYGALLMIIAIAGVVVTSQAVTHTQYITPRATTYQIVGCNQPCTNNRNCEPNHFCHQGRCRLATNPESDTCKPPSQEPISETVEDTTSPTDESKGHDPQAAADIAAREESLARDQDRAATTPATQQPDEEMPVEQPIEDQEIDQDLIDEGQEPSVSQPLGILDLLMGDDNTLLFTVLGAGAIGLLVIVATVTLLNNSKRKAKDQNFTPPDFSNLEKK